MRSRKVKNWVAVLTALVVSLAVGIAVYAYLSSIDTIEYAEFEAATSADPIVATTSDGEEYVVSVGESLDYSVFVRAAVVVTWQDDDGNIFAEMPVAGEDYTIECRDGWFIHEGFYYYSKAITVSTGTGLIVKTLTTHPDGYKLNVQIISQTIQALGETDDNSVPAVTDAWGVTVVKQDDGTLTIEKP